ncbi:helix-turn-helix transcriptional regulator [Actinomadura sp. NAK00032]|uniref:helix-turn-helix domain-containing protein n=1 Tax=Actinomadura sp. NAK00032 TaxID=2742128 RepID=UPI001591FD1F|nr:helix-turn-helix transcriptional regulator [Actinomadura sp. NAK00032]QKW34807.1 helix-turn-helix transcriptional regulator [Actinomadura sp. NAK00032]
MEFAGALRQAVQASGLTLERIRHRLGRRGLTVSVATLSYWQRGRSRPRSRTVVVALEEVLQVPPGTLTELLDDPAPTAAPPRGPAGRGGPAAPGGAGDRARSVRDLWPDPERYACLVGQLDRSGDHRLERLSIHDVYRLDEVRRSWTLSVRTVVRAAGDDIDRIVCVHQVAGGPAAAGAAGLTGVRYCRPGRVRAEGGLMAFELVFDRVLSAGDTAVVEYELGPAAEPPSDSYDRRFAHPVHDYVAIIQFDGGRLPARCYGFTAESSHAPRRRLGELWVGTSGSANIAVGSVRRGIVGIEWEWH